MIELLSLVLGGLLRLAPEVFGFLRASKEEDHEYRMTQLQLDIDKARAQQALDLAHANAAIAMDQADMQALIEGAKAQAQLTGMPRIDAINATVRPVLTYWWCMVLYTSAKAITIAVALQETQELRVLAPILVTDFDRAVIGSMLAFWFVDRSLRKFGRPA